MFKLSQTATVTSSKLVPESKDLKDDKKKSERIFTSQESSHKGRKLKEAEYVLKN